MTDIIKPTIKQASFSCPCTPGTDVARQPSQPEPSEEWPEFPGPLMHAQMDKDVLFRFIRWKAQRCLQQIHKSDQVEEYFFWQIMELFCFRNRRLMMCEVACLLIQCYMLLRKKTSKHKGAKRGKEWCIPLAQLLCMSAPDDELREAVVKMGDDLASRGLTYAAHICYVVVKVDLGSHTQFELIGCDSSRMPFGLVVLSEAIMRTETYEYVLSLISGLAQPSFQMLKLCQASRLAYFDLAEGNSCCVAQKYCETITRAAMAFPDKITDSFIERLILVSFNLLEEKAEEPEWLLDLQELHKMKLLNANAYGEPDQLTVSTSHEVVSESQEPVQDFDQKWHTDPEALFNARYTVQEPLGTGGFGSVYAGVREKDGKQVAIKFVNKKKLSNTITIPGEVQVLPLEVALMKMVSKAPRCNNVVELLEWFDLGIKYIMILERPSACMDVWEFATLHDHCLSEGQAKDIMLQVVWAARHCCERGVVHFDIKAENILINTDTMEVKLIDFGAGELLKDNPYQTFSGTKGYEPPEWLINEEYKGIPATIWGLGILMYYLVCGYYPFESKEDFFTGHLELRTDMSRECFDLMMWCLDLNPEMRPGFNVLLRHEWFTEAGHSK